MQPPVQGETTSSSGENGGLSRSANQVLAALPAVVRVRLTKRLLMRQPTGHYIVSNCYKPSAHGAYVPAYEGVVLPLQRRGEQWQAMKKVAVDGRLCWLFESREACEAWRNRSQRRPNSPPECL